MSAGVEPEPEQTDGDAGAEEKGQDPPSKAKATRWSRSRMGFRVMA
jgi:hypothetical protein